MFVKKAETAWNKFFASGSVADYIDYRRSLLSEIAAESRVDVANQEGKNAPEHRGTGDKREYNG